MIKQIINTKWEYKSNEAGISLNDRDEFIFKKPQEITAQDKQIYKRILEKVEKENVHPSVVFSVKSHLIFWACGGTQGLTVANFCELRNRIIYVMEVRASKSYIQKISNYANGSDVSNALNKRLGIISSKDYNPNAEKYLEILKRLDAQGADLIYPDSAIRYTNAAILDGFENEILNKIDLSIRNNPDRFLKELNKIKDTKLSNSYVIDKLIAQAEVWQVMLANDKLKRFPFKDIWRFCIDVEFQKYGAYIFENEPGYMVATLRTLRFSLELKHPKFSDYIEINRKCGENVYKALLNSEFLCTVIRNENTGNYGVKPEEIDEAGFKDLNERSEIPGNFFNLGSCRGAPHSMIYIAPTPKALSIGKMMFLFDQHEQMLAITKNKGERLMAHLELVRELELHHHFRDGNGRASHILLLSLLANDPELPMMLYDTDPNLMDVTGPVSFFKRVLSGMENFNKTCGINELPLCFEEMDKMANISKKCWWSDYHPSEQKWEEFSRAFASNFEMEELADGTISISKKSFFSYNQLSLWINQRIDFVIKLTIILLFIICMLQFR